MTPQRVSAKLFTRDPSAPVDLRALVGVFHRFIQEGRLEGLLIDVADYSHVPEGPGVVLLGHDAEYALDLAEGRAGLLTTRKRYGDPPTSQVLVDLLRRALAAACAIEADGAAGLRFATDAVEVRFVDRLRAPNTEPAFAAMKEALAPLAEKLFGPSCRIERIDAEEPRRALAARLSVPESVPAQELLGRLGAGALASDASATGTSMDKQSDWDISVEDLKGLRDEGVDFVLIDVREEREYAICHLGGELVPLGTLTARIDDFDRGAHIVVYCRSGARSAHAVALMRGAGFENVWNVAGGILAWADRIDPSVPKY